MLGCECGGCCETPLDARCVDDAWPANLPSLYRSGLGLGLVFVLMLVLVLVLVSVSGLGSALTLTLTAPQLHVGHDGLHDQGQG